jgi:hypothetical protein
MSHRRTAAGAALTFMTACLALSAAAVLVALPSRACAGEVPRDGPGAQAVHATHGAPVSGKPLERRPAEET